MKYFVDIQYHLKLSFNCQPVIKPVGISLESEDHHADDYYGSADKCSHVRDLTQQQEAYDGGDERIYEQIVGDDAGSFPP